MSIVRETIGGIGQMPRVRYDQLMKFCWTFLTPLALIYLAITAVMVVFL
jgi:NADH:ubiquinone oxidoreductase subunit H